MSFEMTAFCVGFSATREFAEVDASFFEIRIILAVVFDGGATGMRLPGPRQDTGVGRDRRRSERSEGRTGIRWRRHVSR